MLEIESLQSNTKNPFSIDKWEIDSKQHYLFIGLGRDDLSKIKKKLLAIIHSHALEYTEVSWQEQQHIIDQEILRAKVGLIDEINHGTLVETLLNLAIHQLDSDRKILELLQLEGCLRKSFRMLSSGETRRCLIAMALLEKKNILILDKPYEGIDKHSIPVIKKCLEYASIENYFQTCICFLDKKDLEPDFVTYRIIQKTQPIDKLILPELPEKHPFRKAEPLSDEQPLIDMKNISVRYADDEFPIINNLNWRVDKNQHWRIIGKNGSGKTTLLKLVTGDHPQSYSNNILVCGYQRGSGESIWSIKRYIGYMSSETLWQYHGSGQLAGTTLDVIISGMYDTVGLYQNITGSDIQSAKQWLTILNMGEKQNLRFKSLNIAEQRMVLIARAMIKRPDLLILDEPIVGLDAEEKQLVITLIEQLIHTNTCTILYVTHRDEESPPSVNNILDMENPG